MLLTMKRKFFIPIFIMFAVFSLSSSCEKEDSGDGTVPEITILGLNPLYWALDVPYVDMGAVAYDITSEGDTLDLTSSIVINNNVKVSEVGEYNVKYNVTDASGLAAPEKIRIVKVVLGK